MNAINNDLIAAAETSSYHAVKLLMQSALDYMQQAAQAFDKGDGEGWCKCIVKSHTIILALRSSLDLGTGGSLADNLDSLYEYMQTRLNTAFEDVDTEALTEVYGLLEEIKSGWDGIEDFAEQAQALHA